MRGGECWRELRVTSVVGHARLCICRWLTGSERKRNWAHLSI